MTEVHVTTRIRKDLGYADLSDSTVRCEDCRAKLLVLKKVKESTEKISVQCNCFCGGTSFKVNLEGKFYFAPSPGLAISKIEDGVFYMEKVNV